MYTSDKGKKKLMELEGVELKAYLDTGGKWTIGVGSLDMPSGRPVKQGDTITYDEAMQLLAEDLKPAEKAVNAFPPMPQNQFDALVCFAFNLGGGALNSSTLKQKILAGAPMDEIEFQWYRWCNVNKKPDNGVLNRRKKEFKVFSKGEY